MAKHDPVEDALAELASLYRRNGYVRWASEERKQEEGRSYRRGEEVRLVASSRTELAKIRRLLRLAGFKPGAPHAKRRQFRQPLYGAQVVGFLTAIGVAVPRAKKRKWKVG